MTDEEPTDEEYKEMIEKAGKPEKEEEPKREEEPTVGDKVIKKVEEGKREFEGEEEPPARTGHDCPRCGAKMEKVGADGLEDEKSTGYLCNDCGMFVQDE